MSVIKKRLNLLDFRQADLHLLFGCGDAGFGPAYLSFGYQIFALRVVYLLLCDQTRLLFGDVR